MLELKEPHDSTAYIMFTESGLKNHQGGLKQHQVSNKSIKYFANNFVPRRCGVRLYKKYMPLCPPDASHDVSYLKPFPESRFGSWHYACPVGHNVPKARLYRNSRKVGAQGYLTNHSLCRTCATRFFQKGIDGQQIMAIVAQWCKSLQAWAGRNYKWINPTCQEVQNG